MDKVSVRERSRIMRLIKSENTKLEISFWKALRGEGINIRHRKNSPKHYGRPDIVIPSRKLVIFLDSCFWHGCQKHLRMPKQNKNYWKKKIERNKQRDQEVSHHYKDKGWKIIRIWEHQLKGSQLKILNRVRGALT